MNTHFHARMRAAVLLAVAIFATLPASARITKSRSSASSNNATPDGNPSLLTPFYSLVLGVGIEYQRDHDQTEYGFPILIEYNFSDRLKLTIEPKYTHIIGRTRDVRSVSGFGDLDVTLDYEFLRERRYRPALSLEGGVRFPTAADPDLGERGRDYAVGIIASKDYVFMDVDINVIYTRVGDREKENTIESSLATEWRLNRYWSVIGEVSNVRRLGTLRGEEKGGRNESEATLGLGWQFSRHLKFEQGIVFKEHGVREIVFAWEWDIGGD